VRAHATIDISIPIDIDALCASLLSSQLLTPHRRCPCRYISKNLTMLTAKADEILKEVSLEEDVEASEAGGGMAS
jgi:hypothetical protein